MASLYVTAGNARKILVVVLILAGVVIFADTFLKFNAANQQVGNEASRFYMNINRTFNEVEKAKIPSLTLEGSTPVYVFESVFSAFPDVSYVYKIEKPVEKLNSLENARKTAQVLGFDPIKGKDLGNNNFSWTNTDETKTLDYNKVSQIWNLQTDFINNLEAKLGKKLSNDKNTYNTKTATVITRLGFETTGLDSPFVESRYALIGVDGVFVETSNVREAQYIVISANRKLPQADLKSKADQPKVDDESLVPEATVGKVYPEDPRRGQLNMIVSNEFTDLTKNIFQMQFINYEYSTEKGSYSIVSPSEAWNKIQRGEGALTSIIPQGGNAIGKFQDKYSVRRFVADARSTELGFYEPTEWTGFVYPIYIFKGRAELSDGRQASFVYYVEAIKRL